MTGSSFFNARQPRGMTLLEVSIAVGVLATAIMGMFSLFMSTERMGIIAREESIALYAAEAAINEIRTAPFTTSQPGVIKIVADYNNNTQAVSLDGPNATQQRLSMGSVSAPIVVSGADGLKAANELGIILITEESPDESHFGDVDADGDLDFPVDLNQNGRFNDILSASGTGNIFPRDLGGDSTLNNESLSANLMKLAPIVVVVRWNSMAQLERRIQVITFITDRLGDLP